MNVGFKTDKGIQRSNNEDAFFVMERDHVYLVADGVGGSKSGEIASRTAVTEVVRHIEAKSPETLQSDEEIRAYLEQCVQDANDKVLELSERFTENNGMATTLLVAYLRGNILYFSNVGDSRGYVCRKDTLVQITEDHTYVNQLLKEGHITREQAKNHENKNMITRAVGAEERVDVDLFKIEVRAGDRILLCTDGLYGEVEEGEMERIMAKHLSMTETCRELVRKANQNGGGDNITVVCVEITEEDIL